MSAKSDTPIVTAIQARSKMITAYISELIVELAKITILEFAHEIQTRFYPTLDISFMEYFFELSAQENEGTFIVPHTKLIEYGVVTSTRSNDVKDRLAALNLAENEDFTLRNIPQRNKNGRLTFNYF